MNENSEHKKPWDGLNPDATVPKTIRLPQTIAFQMDYYSQSMGSSLGRWLTTVLEDVLPAFEPDASPNVKLRLPQVLQSMRKAKMDVEPDVEELKKKVTEGVGPGRPRKRAGGKIV